MFSPKWENRFLEMAHLVASWSKDPSTKVGAVIVDDNKRIVSVGYNGFPIGVVDSEDRYNEREVKYKLVCHAEKNALDNFSGSVRGYSMFVTLPACNECAKSIIQRGIKNVYYAPLPEKLNNYNWVTDVYNWNFSKIMFDESGVKVSFINA